MSKIVREILYKNVPFYKALEEIIKDPQYIHARRVNWVPDTKTILKAYDCNYMPLYDDYNPSDHPVLVQEDSEYDKFKRYTLSNEDIFASDWEVIKIYHSI